MRNEIENIANEIEHTINLLKKFLKWEKAQKKLKELNEIAQNPNIWNDTQKAQNIMKEKQTLEKAIESITALESELHDAKELIKLATDENNQDVISEAEEQIKKLHETLETRQMETLLSGKLDGNDTYFEVHSGAGGTESNDWANMLLRMYLRWCEKNGFKTEIQSTTPGDEVGVKSATVLVKGENAYGWMKTESGVHRLVRISPFDSNAKRHTSFSSIWVYPVIDEEIEIEINDADIRVDTYRSSGAGGQHVNTTDSAVRITHLPTGIVATSSEKSQHQNRANAMKALRARLYDLEIKKREQENQASHDSKTEIGWGHQIRSYVLQPYQMVKDLRTGVESSNPNAILDGDLNTFMQAALAHQIKEDDNTIVEDIK